MNEDMNQNNYQETNQEATPMLNPKPKKEKSTKIFAIILIVLLLIGGGFLTYKILTEKPSEPNNTEKEKEKEKKQEKDNISNTVSPILYEVTKEGSTNKMYLFGSIHATKKDGIKYPEYVLNAYNNSHYIACEVNIYDYQNNLEAQVNSTKQLLLTDGTTVKDHLSNETYTKVVDFLTKKKLYNKVYEAYSPYIFVSLIANSLVDDANLDASNAVDMTFLKKATEDKKNIIEVESIESQYKLLTSFDDTLYDLMLNENIDNYNTAVNDLKNLYDAWEKGDVTKLITMAGDEFENKDEYTTEQKKAIEEYNNALVNNRNNEMAKKAIQYFNNNQDVFYMVGILHIIGDNGIAKQLENQGFTVKQVS